MKLRWKIANAGLVIVVAAIAALLIAMSYESDCTTAPPLAAGTPSMKAALHRCYGPPDVITIEEVAKPSPKDNQVLVRVHAAAVNPLDWHMLRGEPYFMRLDGGFGSPDDVRLGVDFAGIVEAVGKDVTAFRPGDEVFGGSFGALAEYVTVRAEGAIALKPQELTFEQAAAVPVAAVTALQALRDKGGIQPGYKVLINGASGGVGTFAVQIAKAFGAEVTGVCSTRNLDMVRALGADHVVDYTREDVTQSDRRYDLIIDNVSSHSLLEYSRVMQPNGTLVTVGSTDRGVWIGPMKGRLKAILLSPFVDQHATMILAQLNQKDLNVLADLMRSGKVTPVIDRRYGSHQIPDAIRYVEKKHARGKVVVTFQNMVSGQSEG